MFLLHRKKQDSIYPSFMTRLLSSVIDIGIATILIVPIFMLLYKVVYNGVLPTQELRQIMNEVAQNATTLHEQSRGLETNQHYREFIAKGGYTKIFIEQSFQIFILSAMVIFFWIRTQSTPGKLLLSMKIVDNETMKEPSLFQYIRRLLAYTISVLPFGLGLLYIAFNKKHRALHDLISGTVVISTKSVNISETRD